MTPVMGVAIISTASQGPETTESMKTMVNDIIAGLGESGLIEVLKSYHQNTPLDLSRLIRQLRYDYE